MFLIHTNISRKSENVLKSQKNQFFLDKKNISKVMNQIQKIGYKTKKILLEGNVIALGKLFDDHWNLKKKLSPIMSSKLISNIYQEAKNNGAIGGKIIGAGGGGYFLFIVNKKNKKKFFSFLKKKKTYKFTI